MRHGACLVPIQPLPSSLPVSFPSLSTLSVPMLNVHQDSFLCRDPKQGGVKALDAISQPAAEAGGTRVGQPVDIPAAKRHLRGGKGGRVAPAVMRRAASSRVQTKGKVVGKPPQQ